MSRPSPGRSYGRRESPRPVEEAFDRLINAKVGGEKDKMEDVKVGDAVGKM